jgi:hypothetical protein
MPRQNHKTMARPAAAARDLPTAIPARMIELIYAP